MKISLNTIRFTNQHYGTSGDPAPDGVDKLAERIGAQLGAIEEIIDVGSKYDKAVIVKIAECEKLENSDHLNKCLIDDAGKVQGVERDASGYVQVLTGAPNVYKGMTAVWLPPGSIVPVTANKDPFVLESRTMRGAMSHGMLASAKELAIGDSHEGILEIDKDVAPGTSFNEAFNLNGEVVIDIENKMFTHRPDCFGFIGIARELAGIQQQPYKSPEWYTLNPEIPAVESDKLPLNVKNEIPELVPRFTAITMSGVEIKPSPVWLQIFLSEVGLRPINNIVDYSNFFMLETGQPIHIYDYDKVKSFSSADSANLTVRHPRQGEKITLLNGKTIEPGPSSMMVATDKILACVGGAMGGSEAEVSEDTKNIIVEAATWDMYQMRRTSMEHGIFTDAVTRFTKGQSPLQNKAVVAKIVDEIRKFAGGKVASELIDDIHLPAEVLGRGSVRPPVNVSTGFINARLGLDLSAEEVSRLLTNVEFQVETNGEALDVSAPFWRTDIEIPEDIVEEVGRLYGYDKLPLDLPKRDLTPAQRDTMLDLKSKIRDIFSSAGANEVLTYGFVHGNLLDKVGQDKNYAFQLANALSPDLQYYRLSITPNLLEKIHPNIKSGYSEFALFEIGKAHIKERIDEDGLPKEFDRVAFIRAADAKTAKSYAGAPYYHAKKYLIEFLRSFGLDGKVTFELIDANDPDQSTKYYEPGRSATIKIDGQTLGRIGEYKASVRRALKLPDFCAGFELGLAPLMEHGSGIPEYTPLSRFPKVTQDITLKVAADLKFADLLTFVADAVKNGQAETYANLIPLNIFQKSDDPAHKNVTLRLEISDYRRTLTDAEVNKLLDGIAQAAKEKYGAERI